jgi:hypothetical protein
MQILIGPQQYDLRLVRGRLFFNQEECQCRCDHDKKEIAISDLVCPAQRLELAASAVNQTWHRFLRGWQAVPFIGDVPSSDASDLPD